MPLVSIIVPAYRVTPFIRDTLDSIAAQTMRDFETIVINDGCPDTEALERAIEPYRKQIRYVKQSNTGLAGARNAGLAAAGGEFVAFLDGDDMWAPEYLETQLDFLNRHADVSVVFPDAEIFGDSPLAGRRFSEIGPEQAEVTIENLLHEKAVVMVSALARREIVDRVGRFDADLRSVEDFDLWLRIVQAGGRIAYQPRVLVRYRKHAGSLSTNTERMIEYRLRVLDKLERDPGLTPAERSAAVTARERWIAERQLVEGKRSLSVGDYSNARHQLTTARRYFPSLRLSAILWLLRIAPPIARWIQNSRSSRAA